MLPQAVRNVLPDLLSNTLVVKLTSLGSVVAVHELLTQARQAPSITYNPTPIVMAAIFDPVADGAAAEPAGEPGVGGKRVARRP